MRRALRKKLFLRIYQALYRHFGPQNWWPGETKLEIIIGAILTQNTSWKNVEKAIKNLKAEKLLDEKKLYLQKEDEIAKFLRPVGYYNIKAKRVKEFIRFLTERYQGKIENLAKKRGDLLRRELLKIKGIGKETADSILLYALNRPFFVIDAYTKRVLARHKILNKEADYDTGQKLFHQNLPRKPKLYNEFHALFVRLGKTYCRKEPDCQNCPLANFF